MKLLASSVVVLVFAVAFTVAAEDADADGLDVQTPKARPVGVIYLVDLLLVPGEGSETNDSYTPEERKDGGVALTNPIGEDESLPDGVYFRPENGKPVEKSEVKLNVNSNRSTLL